MSQHGKDPLHHHDPAPKPGDAYSPGVTPLSRSRISVFKADTEAQVAALRLKVLESKMEVVEKQLDFFELNGDFPGVSS